MQRVHILRLAFPAIFVVALLAILVPAMVLAQDEPTPEPDATSEPSQGSPPVDGTDGLSVGDPIPADWLYPEPSDHQSSQDSAGGASSPAADEAVPERDASGAQESNLAPAPAGLTLEGFSDTTITIKWNFTPDIARYQVQYRESEGPRWLVAGYLTVPAGATGPYHEYTKTGLSFSTLYDFRVASRGDGDPYSTTYGEPTAYRSWITDKERLGPPSGITLTSANTSVSLSWSTVDHAKLYWVQYKSPSSTDWQHGGFASADRGERGLTVSGLTACTTYKFRVSTASDGSNNLSRQFGKPSATKTKSTSGCVIQPPPQPPSPVKVSFGSKTYTVNEGSSVSVTVRFDKKSTKRLVIPVTFSLGSAEAQDAYIRGYPSGGFVFNAGDTSKSLTLHARQDDDSDDDSVFFTLGTMPSGATKGSPSQTKVTIEDDDLPAPTNLRVHAGYGIRARWDSVAGATGYKLRYALVECKDVTTPNIGKLCEPKEKNGAPDWEDTVTITPVSGDTQEWYSSSTKYTDKLLWFEVQATSSDMGNSGWSGHAFAYPDLEDSAPLFSSDRVGGIDATSYLKDGNFDYVICNPPASKTDVNYKPLPAGASVKKIQDLMNEVVADVQWTLDNGNNIIRATGGVGTANCDEASVDNPPERGQIMFYDDAESRRKCSEGDPHQPRAYGCWIQLRTQEGLMPLQSMVLNTHYDWTSENHPRCDLLREVVLHEATHVYGLVHEARSDDDYSINAMASAAYGVGALRGWTYTFCSLQPLDVALIMMAYQTRYR